MNICRSCRRAVIEPIESRTMLILHWNVFMFILPYTVLVSICFSLPQYNSRKTLNVIICADKQTGNKISKTCAVDFNCDYQSVRV